MPWSAESGRTAWKPSGGLGRVISLLFVQMLQRRALLFSSKPWQLYVRSSATLHPVTLAFQRSMQLARLALRWKPPHDLRVMYTDLLPLLPLARHELSIARP